MFFQLILTWILIFDAKCDKFDSLAPLARKYRMAVKKQLHVIKEKHVSEHWFFRLKIILFLAQIEGGHPLPDLSPEGSLLLDRSAPSITWPTVRHWLYNWLVTININTLMTSFYHLFFTTLAKLQYLTIYSSKKIHLQAKSLSKSNSTHSLVDKPYLPSISSLKTNHF